MNQYKDFIIMLEKILGKDNVKIDEPMKKHTSFRVGGPVDILVTPESYDQVREVVEVSKKNNVPLLILGNGSNLLVRDGGVRGIIMKLCKLDDIKVEGNKIIAQSGALLSKVSNIAAQNCLAGFEFASGIPGSVGGALTMNAGAYNGEISQVIESAYVLNNNGEFKKLTKEELELGYRMSSIIKYGYTVVEAVFNLNNGEQEKIYGRIQDLSQRRRDKQPLEYPSAGSTFKRPEGHFAAKLIEDSGLKGANVGDAEVSKKHSGFIINKGNATAKDIIKLIEMVQKTVREKYDIDLHTEVMIVGEDN
ncbi:UDP-N-acetylmuramate dehydrogenase [Clostridium sp. MSJ-11]|uniref:UDP-N-acetylenolpyruvoylglucosamine reductase n=1 Tax=Clostridium mobile TaxID=2841512 RepID=A0ABS6EL82_9CLOT|nr:UDP-N-acetylmuramate dehydrogenase [Clostridium mobile]MBU5485169.1 UDP-N-acetylmuramate dehydrogenase [Clostridium mobile]